MYYNMTINIEKNAIKTSKCVQKVNFQYNILKFNVLKKKVNVFNLLNIVICLTYIKKKKFYFYSLLF